MFYLSMVSMFRVNLETCVTVFNLLLGLVQSVGAAVSYRKEAGFKPGTFLR